MIKPGKFFASPARSFLAVSALGLLLAGCGGGGGTPVPPPVTISIGAPVGLGNSPINRLAFPVVLSGPANGTLTVNYSTSDESANGGAACGAGTDYVSKSNAVLTIPSGASGGTVEITVCNPAAFAGAAAMKVTLLSSSANGQLAAVNKVAYGLVNNPASGKLNDTGMTSCSDASTQGACPKDGFANQDGDLGLDANALRNADADGRKGFSFAKAATNAGTAEVVSSNTAVWNCVQDNVTDLVWEAKTALNKTDVFTHAQAQAYVATLNGTAPCGYTDWRLPTPQELASLVDSSVSWSGTSTAATDQTFFAEQQKAVYWTATGDVSDATGAWVVDFRTGLVVPHAKALQDAGVRLVRGTASTPSYQAAVAETVADASTGLTWRTCVDGLSGAACATGSATAFTWQQALARVTALNAAGFAGHSDWRLPNRNELLSLVDHARSNPAIDPVAFPGFPSVGGNALSCWTSTPYAADGISAKAWFVDFISGDVGIAVLTQTKSILLVRG